MEGPKTSGSPESCQSDTMVSYKESLWSKRTTVEKRLIVSVTLVAVLCVVLLVLLLVGLRKGIRAEPVIPSQSTVCNTTACRQRAAIILASIDETLDPCDDFYKFTCQKWKRNNPIPGDSSQYNILIKLQLMVYDDIKGILENMQYKTSQQNVSDKVVMAYNSCISNTQSDQVQALALKELLTSVGIAGWPLRGKPPKSEVFDYDCFSKILIRTGTSPIFKIGINQDIKNITNYVLGIDQPEFRIGRHRLLSATAPENQPIVQAYKTFIRESIKVLDPQINQDELKAIVDNMFDFEVELAKIASSEEERRDIFSRFKKETIAELQMEVPKVNWLRLLNGVFHNVNVTLDEKEVVVVTEPRYVNSTVELLNTVDKATVYNYMGWLMIQGVASFTSRKFCALDFDFSRVVDGVQKISPLWRKCIAALYNVAGFAASGLYVQHKFSAQAKDDMGYLVSELRESFSLLLKKNKWMDTKSKEEALKKLKMMITNIGYPDWLTNNTNLNGRYALVRDVKLQDTFLDTFLNFKQNDVSRELLKLRAFSYRRGQWKTVPAMVNAFYNPRDNSITFPAAILQTPVYTYGLPANINLGSIGYIIGHEITHGFDGTGGNFDGVGDLRNWWTQETKAEFTRRAQCFIDQYGSTFDIQANMTLNGVNTRDENIADNGGVREAFLAQRIAIAKTGSVAAPALPGLEKYTSDQMFFISMGVQWCSNIRTEELKADIQYDTHSPAKYRINIPMQNFDEFAKSFHCPEGSRMNPKNRCILW